MDADTISTSNTSVIDKSKDELAMSKKKLKVLKQALKDDQVVKQKMQKQLDEAQQEIEMMRKQMQDKDAKYAELVREKNNLEDSLLRESKDDASLGLDKAKPNVAAATPKSLSSMLQPMVPEQKDASSEKSKETSASSGGTSVKMVSADQGELTAKISELEAKLAEQEEEMDVQKQMAQVERDRIQAEKDELHEQIAQLEKLLKQHAAEVVEKEHLLFEERQKGVEDLRKQEEILQAQKQKVQDQLVESEKEKNGMRDDYMKLEEKLDAKERQIQDLQKELQQANDEITLRKTVNEQMGQSLIKHETESMHMSQKLTLMKNQILEYDKSVGMNKKYGAVKHGSIRYTPCTLEFVEQKESKEKSLAAGRKNRLMQYFLVIDSRSSETSVNCENVEEIVENKEKKLMTVVYHLPDGTQKNGQPKLARKQEVFDCCEIQLILKTFNGIRKQIADQKAKLGEPSNADAEEETKSEQFSKLLVSPAPEEQKQRRHTTKPARGPISKI